MQKYVIDGQYKRVLEANGLKLSEVLKTAELPAGTFLNDKVLMTPDEYFRFMEAIGSLIKTSDQYINIATGEGIETFTPAIFAAFCSANGMECIQRLARYKKLIGPMYYDIRRDQKKVSILLDAVDDSVLSGTFALGEFLFLVSLIRKATGLNIQPTSVEINLLDLDDAYSDFFGRQVRFSKFNVISFSKTDLLKPFVSHNESLLNYFLPELNKMLSEISTSDETSSKVRACLPEMLSAGKTSIDDVAKELCVSSRTLQRKLRSENTNFQTILNDVRKTLSVHYLEKMNMYTYDIAYLLGYQEVNSFIRAFTA